MASKSITDPLVVDFWWLLRMMKNGKSIPKKDHMADFLAWLDKQPEFPSRLAIKNKLEEYR